MRASPEDRRFCRFAAIFLLSLGLISVVPGAIWAAEINLDEPIRIIPPDEPPPAAVEEIQSTQPDPEPVAPLTDIRLEQSDGEGAQPGISSENVLETTFEAPIGLNADRLGLEALSPNASAGDENGIAIATLGGINPDAAGLLNEADGGLSATLWHGADRALVAKLLPRLARAAPSRTLRALALRLLLTAGAPPAGEGKPGELLRLRVQTLADMGEYELAAVLLQAPSGFDDAPLAARLKAAQMFRNLNFPGACVLAREQISQSADLYWRKVVIFCQALEGDIEAALVGVDLMSETADPPGAGFVAAIHTMAGGEAPELQSISGSGPFQMAMLRAAGIRAPAAIVETANPAVLRIIAVSSDAAAATRLRAAERAEGLGALPAESVARLYADVEFPEEVLADPLASAELLDAPLARALLYQVVARERVPVARGEAIAAALELAGRLGSLGIMARSLLPEIQAIEPEPLFAWFAVAATRGLMAAGDVDGAMAWHALAMRQIAASPDAARATIELWPLVQLADSDSPLDEPMLDSWSDAQGALGSADAHLRAGNLLSLLAALGHDIPSHYWYAMLGGPSAMGAIVPSPAIDNLLDQAIANERVGEVALLGLVALGGDGPGGASVTTVSRVIQAFAQVGLVDEARALALETALAEGF